MWYLITTDQVIRRFHFTPILIYYQSVCEISLWQTMLQGCSILQHAILIYFFITLYAIFHNDRPCYKDVLLYTNTDILSHCMGNFVMTDHVARVFHFTPILKYYHIVCDTFVFHYDKPCYKVAPFYTNNDILSHCVWYLIMTDHVMKRFHCTPILIYMAPWILLDYWILMQSLCCINSNMYVVN